MTRLVLAAVLVAAASGCSQPPPTLTPVEGVVTLGGKPLAGAEVQFVPMVKGFGGEYIATAVTDENGRFVLKCSVGAGACVGENKVTVAEGPFPEDARGGSGAAQARAAKYLAGLKNRPIPEKFATLAQSPLSVTVNAHQKDYPLDLSQ